MSHSGKKWWIWLIVAIVLVAGTGIYFLIIKYTADPCRTETQEALMEIYPDLKSLRERQQNEMERLLEMHRQQDVIANLKMSNDEITPEQALRLSLDQGNQIAAMRERQHQEFNNMCEAIVDKQDKK
jgi:uncharacterized membrane-anchored protein YhcB (DUF1043 family)